MKLVSDTAEYALRTVLWLLQSPERSQTARQVAAGTRIPTDYQSKVLQQLARAGIVRSTRGIGGGFRLEPEAVTLNVFDIINAVDPLQKIMECPLGLEEHKAGLCPLHAGINTAIEQVEKQFRSTRLIDLLAHNASSVPLGILRSKPAAKCACTWPNTQELHK